MDAYSGRLFGQRDTPDAGACPDVQHTNGRFCFANTEMLAKRSGRGKTQREQRFNEVREEFGPLLAIYRLGWPACPHDFRESQPGRDELIAYVPEKRSVKYRFGRDQKRTAFRRQRKPSAFALQQLKAHKDIENGIDAALRSSRFSRNLLCR